MILFIELLNIKCKLKVIMLVFTFLFENIETLTIVIYSSELFIVK